MKSRWLQELFPGPDLVSQALGLDQSRVRILRRATQKTIYEIRALNSKGEIFSNPGFRRPGQHSATCPRSLNWGLFTPRQAE